MLERHAALILLLTTIACGPTGIATSDGSSDSGTTSPDPTGATETSTQDSSDTGTITDFVPGLPDSPPVTSCDIFEQDCPEGEKCAPYSTTGGSWDADKCVPIMGDQAPGEPCVYAGTSEATDDCDATSMCWDLQDIDGEFVGTCTAFCTGNGDAPMCPPGASCLISGDATLVLCITACDPLLQDCEAGLACYWTGGDFECAFTSEDLPAGQACGFVNDCAAGLICLDETVLPDCAGVACCSPFCDLDLGDAQCAALPGTSCVSFYEMDMAPPGNENIGVCILP